MSLSKHIHSNNNKSVFTCPSCKYEQEVIDPKNLFLLTCSHCYKIHDEEGKYNSRKNQNPFTNSILSIGAKGKIGELEVTVVGIIKKRERNRNSIKWSEFVLVDQHYNYHTLSCSNGNWTYLKQIDLPNISKIVNTHQKDLEYNGKKFSKLFAYYFEVVAAIGQFPDDVFNDEQSKSCDFSAPPEAVILEKYGSDEFLAYHGRHMKREEVGEIFNNGRIANMNHHGVGLAQPFMKGLNVKALNIKILIFLAALTFAYTMILIESKEYTVWGDIIPIQDSTARTELVSPPFEIKARARPDYLQFTTWTDLENEWIEDNISLVNEQTGETRELAFGSEYYSGVDNGYAWSEGSTEATASLSGVSPGRYHIKILLIHPLYPTEKSQNFMIESKLTVHWNFYVLFFSVLLFLLIINYIKKRFELMRSGEIETYFG